MHMIDIYNSDVETRLDKYVYRCTSIQLCKPHLLGGGYLGPSYGSVICAHDRSRAGDTTRRHTSTRSIHIPPKRHNVTSGAIQMFILVFRLNILF